MTSVLLHAGSLMLCSLLACVLYVSTGRWSGVARKMLYLSCGWFGLCSVPVFSDALAWPLKKAASPCLPASCPSVGAIVVLGGGGGTGVGSRIAMGVDLVRRGRADWLILSGGGPGEKPEAEVMRKAAVGYGISRELISIESNSRNTCENAAFTAALLRSRAIKKVLLVTSNLHMARARYAFSLRGIQVEAAGIEVGSSMGAEGWRYWVPSFYVFERSTSVIKEYVGIATYFMKHLWTLSSDRC